MASREFRVAEAIPERSTYTYEVALLDWNGDAMPSSDITAITMTLRDVATDAIVNGREAVDVRNANGGTLGAGSFSFRFAQGDTAIVGTASVERRLMTFDFTLSGGGRVTRDVSFYVRNLRDIG